MKNFMLVVFLLNVFCFMQVANAQEGEVEVTLKIPLQIEVVPIGLVFSFGSIEKTTNSEQGLHCFLYTKEDKSGQKFSKFQMIEPGNYTLDFKINVPKISVNNLKSYYCYIKYKATDNSLFAPNNTSYFITSQPTVEGTIN